MLSDPPASSAEMMRETTYAGDRVSLDHLASRAFGAEVIGAVSTALDRRSVATVPGRMERNLEVGSRFTFETQGSQSRLVKPIEFGG